MVSEEDIIYFRINDENIKFEKGFDSKSEIENYIREEFDSGIYEYGLLDQIGSAKAQQSVSESQEYTDIEQVRIERLKYKFNQDKKVKDFHFIENNVSKIYCHIHQHTVRYEDTQVDFKIYMNNNLFNDPPVSNIDRDIENKIRDIFSEVTDNIATFLGYDSYYAERGNKSPYVVSYGRVHRQNTSERMIRNIEESNIVRGVYRTSENISPIPIYKIENKSTGYLNQDYIIVLDIVANDTDLEYISDKDKKEAFEKINQIENMYPDIQIEWVGKVPFRREYHNIGVGISV
jgi:hypothetical protein